LLGDEIRHRRGGRESLAATHAPFRTRWLLDESAHTQVRKGVFDIERREPRNALPAHRHDDLPAFGGVSYVAAELIMHLAYTELRLQP